MHPDSSLQLFTPSPRRPCRHSNKHNKLLSFLSDSCYLTTSPSSPAALHSDSSLSYPNSNTSRSNSSLSRSDISQNELSYPSEESESLNNVCFSPSELDASLSPYSPSHCLSSSLVVNPNGSGFPQPFFDDNDNLACSSPPSRRPQQMDIFDRNEASEIMDTEDTLFAQSSAGTSSTLLELRSLTTSLAAPTLCYPHQGTGQTHCKDPKARLCPESVLSSKRVALQCVVNLPLYEEKLAAKVASSDNASENVSSSMAHNR